MLPWHLLRRERTACLRHDMLLFDENFSHKVVCQRCFRILADSQIGPVVRIAIDKIRNLNGLCRVNYLTPRRHVLCPVKLAAEMAE